jgi:ubiquinone/menaquinone biosynthesis C-methylase UbiE
MKKYTKKTIEYYNKIAENYFKSDAAIVIKDKIDKFISLLQGTKVLDVACGPGHDTDYLTRKGFNCIGIDLSRRMIEIAKKYYKGKFEIMDFFNLKFPQNSFDGLWCSSVFVHVDKKDLPQLLKNFAKILKDKGILGLITVKKQKIKKNKADKRKYVMYEKKEFENYLRQAGYKILISEIFLYGGKKRLFIIAQNEKKL